MKLFLFIDSNPLEDIQVISEFNTLKVPTISAILSVGK